MVEKVIDKIKKLKATEESYRNLGEEAAAEAFAAKINQMLLEHELNESDIDYSSATKDEEIVEYFVRFKEFGIEPKKQRSAWMERLAEVVAEAHLCKILVMPGSSNIWFVGTRAHAEVAEYAFGTMVPLISQMSRQARRKARRAEKKMNDGDASGAAGYREAWIAAFVRRIAERYHEIRRQSVQNSDIRRGEQTSNSTALVRLNTALLKVEEFVKAKYKKKASAVGTGFGGFKPGSAAGAAAGRAAADAVPLGRTGLRGSGGTRGYLD